jgi:release factor glutamine methyltransferase
MKNRTIKSLLHFAITELKNVGVDSSNLDAKILLEHATGKSRAQIIAHDDYELTPQEQKQFEELLNLRKKRIPISQILGTKEFYGRDFIVDENVLTPRPETELIIDAAKNLFARDAKISILDLGVGSGCILLTLLSEFPHSSGVGADISKKAIAIAKKNSYSLGVEGVELICSNWLEAVKNGTKFDLIVSNPPYISLQDKNKLARELDFEPDSALYAGDDGLECYRKIAESLSLRLNKVDFKYIILEIGQNQETEIIEIFEKQKIMFLQHYKDLNGIIRTLVFTNQST